MVSHFKFQFNVTLSLYFLFVFNMCREVCPRNQFTELIGQDVGLMHRCFIVWGFLCGFVAKQACLVLKLGKPEFLHDH